MDIHCAAFLLSLSMLIGSENNEGFEFLYDNFGQKMLNLATKFQSNDFRTLLFKEFIINKMDDCLGGNHFSYLLMMK